MFDFQLFPDAKRRPSHSDRQAIYAREAADKAAYKKLQKERAEGIMVNKTAPALGPVMSGVHW